MISYGSSFVWSKTTLLAVFAQLQRAGPESSRSRESEPIFRSLFGSGTDFVGPEGAWQSAYCEIFLRRIAISTFETAKADL